MAVDDTVDLQWIGGGKCEPSQEKYDPLNFLALISPCINGDVNIFQ